MASEGCIRKALRINITGIDISDKDTASCETLREI